MQKNEVFRYGSHFEEQLVHALLVDRLFAEQMTEVLDVKYFTLNHLRFITTALFDYYKKYKSFPSIKILPTIFNETIDNPAVKEQIGQYFLKIRKEDLTGDIEYVKETSLDYCRKQKLIIALEKSLDLAENQNYDQIVQEIQKAVQAGSERDIGHIYEEGVDDRLVEESRVPIATPWEPINMITRGGTAAGELSVIMALTGVGKSHALVDIGSCALVNGKTVVHYTFELSEHIVGKRYDSRISGIDFDDLTLHKEAVKEAVAKLPGRIIIKKYANRHATVQTIKNHIAKLRMTGIIPDLVIIDYADIMKSSKSYENKRFEEEATYEELRALADELKLPIWTACQANRVAMDAEVITLKHISECFNKSQIVDLFITMNRTKTASRTNLGNFFIAKSRLGVDGVKFNTLVTTAQSRIDCLTPGSAEEQNAMLESDLSMMSNQEDRIKEKLRIMRNKSEGAN